MANAASFPPTDLDEAFFNDLNDQRPGKESPPRSPPTISSMLNPDCPPRIKRMACILCRKRKLRCDGARPKCGTCGRLSHECGYDEVRKKSGPKRGYVKLLEARLRTFVTLTLNSAYPCRTSRDDAQDARSPRTYHIRPRSPFHIHHFYHTAA
jgi:hypothetical protein